MTSKSSLHQALVDDDISSVETYLSHPSAPTWCQELYRGYTPLAIACKRDISDQLILKILALYPMAASIPTKSDRGYYPVHICAKYGSMKSTVIEALLLEYPYAAEHKAKTRLGILMTPAQLAQENARLSQASTLALQQPIEHWLGLRHFVTNINDRELRDSVPLLLHDTSNAPEDRHLCCALKEIQDQLVDSKNNEIELMSKLTSIEAKIDRMMISEVRESEYFANYDNREGYDDMDTYQIQKITTWTRDSVELFSKDQNEFLDSETNYSANTQINDNLVIAKESPKVKMIQQHVKASATAAGKFMVETFIFGA